MKHRANGEGTIFKRKDGRWSAQAYVTLANGVQKRVCVTVRSREAVRIKLREILDHEARRVPYAEKDWTVEEYLELSTCNTVVISKANTPLEPRNLRRYFDTLIEKVGVPRITIHAMRHTAATILKDLNVPVKDAQLILGHSDISTTLNIYQHGTADTHRYALSAVEELLLKKQVTLKAA